MNVVQGYSRFLVDKLPAVIVNYKLKARVLTFVTVTDRHFDSIDVDIVTTRAT